MDAIPLILLPGGVLPAEPAYSALIEALGPDVKAVAKDLAVYSGATPPPGYSLDNEVDAIITAAEQAGFERFHLMGYSGGGASSLAFTAKHPDRLLSLALFEPAWAGNAGLTPEEEALWAEFERIMLLPPPERMAEFVRVQLADGVSPPPPPPGPPPPWMAKRPAGLAAFVSTFRTYELDLDALRSFAPPVLCGVGGLSNPDYYARQCDKLATVFPDFTVEVYDERHHFDPPHRTEPQRVAMDLRRLWARAGTAVS